MNSLGATSPTPAPLAHLTVVDLTQHLAGPYATQILGDLGARVIKIEPPEGDSTRRLGPYTSSGESAYFISTNRNKESVCINLKEPGGRDALLALVAKSDLIIENFRPGTLKRLQIDYPTLRSTNAKIVLCSISGFGQDGPYRSRPAFDMIVQALSGGMSLTGEIQGRPVRSGLPIGDLCAGMFGVIGSLAALDRARTDGIGSHIDVAMLDSQIALLSYIATYYSLSGIVPGRQGREHMSIPTYRALACRDGTEIVIAANTERMWHGLCEALGVQELSADPLFHSNDLRNSRRDELGVRLQSAASRWTQQELLQRLMDAGVPAAPINRLDEALSDPHIRFRDMLIRLPTEDGSLEVVGNPIKILGDPSIMDAPPKLGQHTLSVLQDLAELDEGTISYLLGTGAICVPSEETLQ